MAMKEKAEKGLWRLKKAMARIESDLNNTTPHRVDPSISPTNHEIIMKLIQFAIWEQFEPKPQFKPEDEEKTWCWALGKQGRMIKESEEVFWTTNRRSDLLKQRYEAGRDSIEELELMFDGRPVTKQLIKLGLLPPSDPPNKEHSL